MKIGGLREDVLFQSKEYPLAVPKKDSRGDGVVTSSISLAAARRAPAHSFRCSSFSHRKTLRWEPCDLPPAAPLKRPKEGLRPFLWKPSRGLRGISGKRARALRRALTGDVETWDERWRLWCLRSFRTPRLVGDEGDDGPADLKPALGIYRLSPLRIPRISVGGGLRPAPPGIAGYSDASVGRGDHTPPNPRPQGSLV